MGRGGQRRGKKSIEIATYSEGRRCVCCSYASHFSRPPSLLLFNLKDGFIQWAEFGGPKGSDEDDEDDEDYEDDEGEDDADGDDEL